MAYRKSSFLDVLQSKKTTLRYHSSDAKSELHNNRNKAFIERENAKREARGDMRFIDLDGERVELAEGLTEREAFARCFGDAVARYNEGQKRADRKKTIDSYYRDMLSDRRGSTKKPAKNTSSKPRDGKAVAKEIIISYGNLDNPMPDNIQKLLLTQYLDGFRKRNPHLYVYSCMYHADEYTVCDGKTVRGTPHIHLDFIPVATGYCKGMDTRCSIGQALRQQGYDGRNAYAEWQAAERQVLEQLALDYGYTVTHPVAGKIVDSKDTADYAASRKRKTELDAYEKRLNARKHDLDRREDKLSANEQNALKKASEDARRAEEAQALLDACWEQVQNDLAEVKRLKQEYEDLQDELRYKLDNEDPTIIKFMQGVPSKSAGNMYNAYVTWKQRKSRPKEKTLEERAMENSWQSLLDSYGQAGTERGNDGYSL